MTGQNAYPSPIHVAIHARPSGPIDHRTVSVAGLDLRVCDVKPSDLHEPLSISFEEVAERLSAQRRLFFEPDGSFVCVGESDAGDWQIDGQLNDSAQGLMTVELKVTGRGADPSPILRVLGDAEQRFLFQWVRHGVYLEPEDVWRLCDFA